MARPKRATPECGIVPVSKRDNIIVAATEVFLEAGYGATSMDIVAARANVSKATIYAHFGSKEALFRAIIEGRCEQEFGAAEYLNAGSLLPAEGLRLIGRRFYDLILSPEALGMYRVVIAESGRNPEVGEAFYAMGPKRGLTNTTLAFKAWHQRGLLHVPDADRAADQFLNMLKGHYYLRRLLNIPEQPEEPSRDESLDAAVATMLKALAVK